MKSKIIRSHTDEKTGSSIVTIQNKYGKFTGVSSCSPEDQSTFSAFAGERYAEMRALKEFAKFRLKQEKLKIKVLEDLLKDIDYFTTTSNQPINSETLLNRINIKLNNYKQSASDWEALYYYYEPAIRKQDSMRQEILKKGKKN